MTTGEYLLSKSPLASGSALQHLLAMQGGGSGKTIFCSQISTFFTEQETVVVSAKEKRNSSSVIERAAGFDGKLADSQQKTIYTIRRPLSAVAFIGTNQITVVVRNKRK